MSCSHPRERAIRLQILEMDASDRAVEGERRLVEMVIGYG
jgi:hypothetical protein